MHVDNTSLSESVLNREPEASFAWDISLFIYKYTYQPQKYLYACMFVCVYRLMSTNVFSCLVFVLRVFFGWFEAVPLCAHSRAFYVLCAFVVIFRNGVYKHIDSMYTCVS
jgi:hypothetical protein